MSWRADLRQQLSHLLERITHHTRALLGTWPGLLTLTLLFIALVLGSAFLARASREAAAQAPSSGLVQLSTRIPTRAAAISATATKTAAATNTTTSTPTSTRRPTPTWTPFPTATQVAASPLLTHTVTPTHTVAATHAVPLPTGQTGPQLAPAETMTGSATLTLPATPEATPLAEPSETAAAPFLLIPSPTPTRTIVEALEQPVAPGGLAGIVATATAATPLDEQVMEESSLEGSIAAEVGVPEAQAMPAPALAATPAILPTPDGTVRTALVPIAMYHYVSVPPANADIYRKDLSVSPDLFAAHLDAIQQAGYTTISLYTLLDHLTHGSPLPEKPVVLTFDDGYRDHYTNAFPLLRDRGMTATFFIVTDFIHDQRPEYLTWDMLREMYAGGMSIEAHGRNHVSLANKDRDYLIWQALGSYESIEVEIGVRPRFISYPAGEYDQNTIDIFRSANYWAGFTTKQGATHHSDDLFQLRRIRIRGTTSPEELLRLLALDW